MYWIIETQSGDFNDQKIKTVIQDIINDCCEDKKPVIITNIIAVFNNGKEKIKSNKFVMYIQDLIDDRFEDQMKQIEQERKAQKQLESEYREGRL